MKRVVFTLLSVIALLALVACGGSKVDDATAEKYIAKAEEIVSLLNDGNYAEIHARLNEEMKAGLPKQDMEELTPLIEQSGNFEEIDKASVEEKDGHYIVVLVGAYSEEDRVFTITFNKDDEVAGLYIK